MAAYYWKYFLKPFRLVTNIIVKSALLLLFLLLLTYFNTSIYDFPEPSPFSGEKLYNPYEGLDTSHWYSSNFHAHGDVWYGLSNGKGSNEDLYHAYLNRLDYDVLGISNYQKIDPAADAISRIRTYEHGYSPTKNHQIVIGASRVCWKEYPLYQSVHHKQHILRILKENDKGENVVAIAHPKRGQAYSYEDMKYLTDYDCVEAFNHLSSSKIHWDVALSAGHPVYLLASDDCHDYEHINHIGRHITMIWVKGNITEEKIINAIKKGQTYGVEIQIAEPNNFYGRKQKILNAEKIEQVEVEQNKLTVQISDTCDTIRFIGQNGIVKKLVLDATSASYYFSPEDTYIRTEAKAKHSGNYLYMNPVFRYKGEAPVKKIARENRTKTLIYRIFVALCMLIVLALFFFIERKRCLRPKAS